MKKGLLDFLQSASNAVAGNVAGPVDLIGMGLGKMGVPVGNAPVGGTEWMKQQGLMRDVEQGPARVLGETAGLLGPAMATQFAPQIAKGLLQAGDNLAAPATLNKQAGAMYFRNTQRSSPDNGTGYMMFADDADRVQHYGKNSWVFDSDSLPGADVLDARTPEAIRKIQRVLAEDRDFVRSFGFGASPKKLANEANPKDIVDAAGLWDSPEAVEKIYNSLIDPEMYRAVLTNNGAIVFDRSLVKATK
jgi:hypothetical protein